MTRLQIIMGQVAVGSALALTAAIGQAADLEKGRAKAEQVCAACHGKDGNTPIDPSYPKLAGQAADYLYNALRDYRREARKNPIMGGMAKPLSDADMKNLSAYYASLPGSLRFKR
ncbi:MAG: cytochrome c [Quisquiliibacterium sp.]